MEGEKADKSLRNEQYTEKEGNTKEEKEIGSRAKDEKKKGRVKEYSTPSGGRGGAKDSEGASERVQCGIRPGSESLRGRKKGGTWGS